MSTRWFEDWAIGEVHDYGGLTVSAEEIVAFARRYDPQYFHVDAEAAKHSPFGGLIASGWHSMALWIKMAVGGLIAADDPASMGSPGALEIRWLVPVRPGDHLRCRSEVVEKVELASRPDRGIIRLRTEMFNQKSEVVMRFVAQRLTRKRPAGEISTT